MYVTLLVLEEESGHHEGAYLMCSLKEYKKS